MIKDRSKATPLSYLRAMADEQRLRILNVLQDGEMCVGDIVQLVNAPQPTVSRNLATLRKANLVAVRRSGLWAFYALNNELNSIQTNLLAILQACSDMPQYALDRQRGIQLRTTEGCCPTQDNSTNCGK